MQVAKNFLDFIPPSRNPTMSDNPKLNGPEQPSGHKDPASPETFNVTEFKELLNVAAH